MQNLRVVTNSSLTRSRAAMYSNTEFSFSDKSFSGQNKKPHILNSEYGVVVVDIHFILWLRFFSCGFYQRIFLAGMRIIYAG